MEQEEQVKKEQKSLEQEERERRRILILVLFLLFVALIVLAIAFLRITGELGGGPVNPPTPTVVPTSEPIPTETPDEPTPTPTSSPTSKPTSKPTNPPVRPTNPPVGPSAEWNVGFISDQKTGIASGSSTALTDCGSITTTGTSATISDVQLAPTNSRCSFPLTIENSGTLNARVSEVVLSAPVGVSCNNSGSEMTCGSFKYKIAVDPSGNTLLRSGMELKISERILAYLIVETVDSGDSSETEQRGARLMIVYNQA